MTTLPIVGARYRPPAEEVLKLLPSGTKLLLRRQPDNPYDENAVQVILPLYLNGDSTTGEAAPHPDEVWGMVAQHYQDETHPTDLHLGFIPREAAKELAPRMDHMEQAEDIKAIGVALQVPGLLTFGLTGLPNVSFEEPKE